MTTDEENGEIGSETSQYPYSVKISQTAYGARVGIHLYSNDMTDAIVDSCTLYSLVRERLKDNGFKLAPEESQPKRGGEISK